MKGGSNGCLCLIPQLCQDTSCLWAFPVFCSLCLNSSLSTAPSKINPPPSAVSLPKVRPSIHSVKPKGWTAHANREFRRPACLEPIFSRALGSSQLTAWWPLTGEQKREGKEQRFSACFQSIPEGNLHIRKGNAKRPLKQRGKQQTLLKLLELQMDDISPREVSCRPAQEPQGTAESLPTPTLHPSHLQSTSLPGS